AVLTAKIYAAIVTSRMLLTTPSSVIAAIVLIVSVMAVLAKLGGLARFSEVSVYVWLPLLTLFVQIIEHDQFYLLRPIFGDASVSDLFKASRQAAYSFAGFDILLFAYPHLHKQKAPLRTVLWAMVFVTAVYVLTTIAATTFLGLEQMTRILAPTLTILSIAETSIVERIDSIALFLWMGIVVITAATQLYMGTRALQGIIKGVSYHKTIMTLGSFLLVITWGDTPLREVVAVSAIFGDFDLSFVAISVVVFLVLIYIKKASQKNAPFT
ncbi:MAG: GerAB/ArcD/ProY family transporter, partial [Peptococcaceae bacterium]|nr:GerAB/ArcD/ProY family transporter [Peptococcaceae bacterium]